jgi:3-hydroxybutyrate dehydrogenase
MTQLAISHFIARKKRGVVIHISSIAGQVPVFYAPMYAASKHAISGLVRSLAPLEFPPNSVPSIRVNAVAPGVVKTPLWTDNKEKLRLLDEESDEWVTPEKVAEAMVDLIEKEEYHGGTVLEVGGGPVRRVEAFDAPRPSAKGNSVSNPKAEVDEIWERLAEQHGRS